MLERYKLLIVGAGVAGRELLDEILLHFQTQYKTIGFIDDDIKKIGKRIRSVSVVGTIDNLAKIIKKYKINAIFIAIPSAKGVTIRRILASCRNNRVIFKIVPRTLEIVQGVVKVNKLRDLRVEDLVGGAIIKEDQSAFQETFEKKSILVTGAAGSIGAELCRQIIEFSPKLLIAFDWWENGLFELGLELKDSLKREQFKCSVGNVQDKSRVREVVRQNRPDYIFHAAAFKHVPLMESNPLEAIRNNVFGTENVAKVAYEEGVGKFIYISTDKATEPRNVMGATKLIGEHIITALNGLGRTKYLAVRFGNVLESYGSVVPIFRKQIASGGPVTVTDRRMTRFMMTIPEAVQLVLNANVIGSGGEMFVLQMGDEVKIDELARFMIQIAGFVPDQDIKIKYIGARPGEKLVERVWGENEYLERTENSRIFKIGQHTSNIDLFALAALRMAVDNDDREKALNILKKFAPKLSIKVSHGNSL